ncbi:tigger transposable element-derived protein 1-like [Palaemon carinicauda]|uniref:tigger transposable element-derived protein 1-like n=1 Tax=Palaemon carinicauda TaxID=392227 RepID=UPI0035B5C15F
MGSKQVSANKGSEKKKRMMTMKMKQEIIAKHETGIKVTELASQYERSSSIICTILKQKDAIKSTKPSKGVTILSKLRSDIHDEMERLLLIWIKEKTLAGDSMTETIISSSDVKATADFITTFALVIARQGLIPQQVFNCDETGLFGKRMPRRTFITAEEKSLPGHKPMKDRLTLAYENPRAFKSQRILKERLQVMWCANAKAWFIQHFFTEWVNLCFGPAVKKYLAEKNLSLKCLLVLDNAPGHLPGLKEDILDEFRFIKVLYPPAKHHATTPAHGLTSYS